MTMVALPTVLLWTSLVAGFEPPREQAVILEFVAENCPHCRTMDATVRRLRGDGFPVYRIDAQRDRAEAERFGIQGTPTYVLLVRDRAVDRIEGAASYDRIARMFREQTANAVSPSPAVPPLGTPSTPTTSEAVPGTRPPAVPPTTLTGPASATPAAATAAPTTLPALDRPAARLPREVAERAALAATARLRVADEGGTSVATGTVVDVHNGHALILTCGHVFRQAGMSGQIKVDLFAPGAGAPLDGRLITFDLLRDVGLVSIRTDIPIRPVALAPSGYSPEPQTEVFSVGCDNGGQPRIERARITRRNGYSGPPNLEATGAPVNGRSGGGLFDTDGQLIGVCNAANEPENKGVYAAFETVHWVVTQAGLQKLIPANASLVAQAIGEPSRIEEGRSPAAPPFTEDPKMIADGDDEELLLVVRKKGTLAADPRYYPLSEVPADVWERAMARRELRQLPKGQMLARPSEKQNPAIAPPPAMNAPPAIADTRRDALGPLPGARPAGLPARPEAKVPVMRGQQPGVWPFLN
jgi:thiol-disulfide isomerase/thioredoxin